MATKEGQPPIDIRDYRARKSLLGIGEAISRTFGPQPFLSDIAAFNELLKSGRIDVKTIENGRSLGVKLPRQGSGQKITVHLRANLLDMDFTKLKTKQKTRIFLAFDGIAHTTVLNHAKQNPNAVSA